MTSTSARISRSARVVFAAAVYLVTASVAHATMTCLRFEQFSAVSDPQIRERLEAHVGALPGLKSYEIRHLEGSYFLVQAEGKFCKTVPRCEHRLLALRDGVVRNVFAFRGTGAVWSLLSPLGAWLEDLQDDYSAWAFETIEDTFIRVDLPTHRDMIVIFSPTTEGAKSYKLTCDILTK